MEDGVDHFIWPLWTLPIVYATLQNLLILVVSVLAWMVEEI